MRPTRRTALAGATALLVASAAGAQTDGVPDITGSYAVVGRNTDGSVYTGEARIRQQSGQWLVEWTVGAEYAGFGTLDGRVLTVNWGDVHPGVYVVMPDGELHGTWADGTALERLAPR